MLLAKVERELQVAVNQAKRGFVIREAREEDLVSYKHLTLTTSELV